MYLVCITGNLNEHYGGKNQVKNNAEVMTAQTKTKKKQQYKHKYNIQAFIHFSCYQIMINVGFKFLLT